MSVSVSTVYMCVCVCVCVYCVYCVDVYVYICVYASIFLMSVKMFISWWEILIDTRTCVTMVTILHSSSYQELIFPLLVF